MIEIVNSQRKFTLDLELFTDFAEKAIEKISETRERAVTIAFISDGRMRKLNLQFRAKHSTTDVLSFPFEPEEFETDADYLGDIVISVAQAEKQSRQNSLTLEHELKQLILHGILHLCGYDHETDDGQMNARELELRELLKI